MRWLPSTDTVTVAPPWHLALKLRLCCCCFVLAVNHAPIIQIDSSLPPITNVTLALNETKDVLYYGRFVDTDTPFGDVLTYTLSTPGYVAILMQTL